MHPDTGLFATRMLNSLLQAVLDAVECFAHNPNDSLPRHVEST